MSILDTLKRTGEVVVISAALSANAAEQTDQYVSMTEPTLQVLQVSDPALTNDATHIKELIAENWGTEKADEIQNIIKYSSSIKDEGWDARKMKAEGCQNTLKSYQAQLEAANRYIEKYQELTTTAQSNNQTQFEFDGKVFDLNKNAAADFANVFIARDQGKDTVEVAGKTYSTQSNLSLQEQQDLYGNINAEVSSPQSAQTKILMSAAVQNDVEKKNRLYEIAAHSGYPEIEPEKDSSLSEHSGAKYIVPIISTDTVGHIHLRGYNVNEIPDEMAHAWRNTNHVTGEVGAALADFSSLFNFSDESILKQYADKTNYEGDTHENVEKEIRKYINGGTEDISIMYANIVNNRQEAGAHWTLTDEAKKMVQEGNKLIAAREIAPTTPNMDNPLTKEQILAQFAKISQNN